MRHPSENFIKFLMLQPTAEAKDDKWVIASVAAFSFPRPMPAYVEDLRKYLKPLIPHSFQPTNRYHRESVYFLRQQGIYSLFNPDAAVRESGLILTDLRARPLVETLLLGRVPSRDVAKKVNAKLQAHYTTAAIEAYRNYYWNVPLLRAEDWALVLASENEQKSRALAILQTGPALALHMAGFEQQIESKTMLKDMQVATYFDFKEWQAQPRSEARTKSMSLAVKSACQLDFQLSQADAAMREALKHFEKFRMQHAQNAVVDIRSLAPAGNFSQSGARLLEAKKEEAVPESEEIE